MGEDFATDSVFEMEDINGAILTLYQEQSESGDCQGCYLEIAESENNLFGLTMDKIDRIISELQNHKKRLKKWGYDKSESLAEAKTTKKS